jgi:DNA-binding LytR/AlgR family response regulator
VKYGNFVALTLYQRLVNNIALALLSIACWLSIGYGLFYAIFGNELAVQLIPVLPVLGFIGLLIYLLIMQRFRLALNQKDQLNETTEEIVITEEVKSKKDIQTELLERIAVKSGTKIHVVLVPEILYLQADGDYVQIITAQGKYLKEQTMKYFEEHLPENQFVRVHRSVIVNVEMISRIELYEKQNQLLTLKNGQQIKTSPGGYKALRLVLNL